MKTFEANFKTSHFGQSAGGGQFHRRRINLPEADKALCWAHIFFLEISDGFLRLIRLGRMAALTLTKLKRFETVPLGLGTVLSIFLLSACCHHVNIPQHEYGSLASFDYFATGLNTGDIILFHGDSAFDKITDYLECSPWAHVGMIVKGKDNQAYLWESTLKSNVKDIDYHKMKSGPQLVRLKDRLINDVAIKDHSGWAVRRLIVSESIREPFDVALSDIIQIEHDKDIPGAVNVFLEAALGRYLHVETNENKIFCSELMVLTYMQMGLISKTTIANGFVPKDFSSDSNKLRFLQKGTRLTEENYFKPVMVKGALQIRMPE